MAAVAPSGADSSAPVPGEWTTGLCGCMEDCRSCLFTCICPCAVVGQIAEIVTGGRTDRCAACSLWFGLQFFTVCGCGCLYSHVMRKKLRAKYSLPEEPMKDVCMHLFCPLCSFCQEYRELQNRGWDPAKAYTRNLKSFVRAKQPSQGPLPPVAAEAPSARPQEMTK